ncbi:MAG TPA: tyrosinase family protein [Leptolyngbyaceae cyanobacterium]
MLVSSLIAKTIAIVSLGFISRGSQPTNHSIFAQIASVLCSKNALQNLHKFLLSILICTILAFGIVVTPAQASTTYIRKQAHSPEAKKDLESLEIAFEKMRQMDCTNPLSWYYQGAIHQLPAGDGLANLETNPLCSSYTKSNPNVQKGWNNCTHTGQKASQRNFLVWHRLYLYHFENIVRALSGNPNFALPYWKYVSLDSNSSKSAKENNLFLTLPQAFRDPSNSLYEDARYERLLNGEEIDKNFLKAQIYKSVKDLRRRRTFVKFNEQIENFLHNYLHAYVGGIEYKNPDPTATNSQDFPPKNRFNKIYNSADGDATTFFGLLSDIPTAGFDPIFWLHHGNIDRIWTQWTKSEAGKGVTVADLKDGDQEPWKYTFFDPEVSSDGTITAKEVTYTLEEAVKKIYNLGYEYDDTPMVDPSSKQFLAQKNQPSVAANKVASLWEDRLFAPEVSSDSKTTAKKINYTLENANHKVYNLGYEYSDRSDVNHKVYNLGYEYSDRSDVNHKVYNLGYEYDGKPMLNLSSEKYLAQNNLPSTSAQELGSRKIGKVVDSEHPLDLKLNLTLEKLTELRLLGDTSLNPSTTKDYTINIDVTYTGRPYGTYDVYLDMLNEGSKSDIDTFFIGTISFFVLPADKPVTKSFEFDITDELIEQANQRVLKVGSQNITLSIRKTSGDKSESVKIERIALYEK